MDLDDRLPAFSHSDPFNGNVKYLLDLLDVVFGVLREVAEFSDAFGAGLPAGHGDVFDFNFSEFGAAWWEVVDFLAVDGVGDAKFDLGEGVQDVQFGYTESGVAVDHVGELEDDEVQPAASPFSFCGDTDFVTAFLEHFTNVLQRKKVQLEDIKLY